MRSISLPQLVTELTAAAHSAPSGRASRALRTGPEGRLRQVVIALRAGAKLHDHESPGDATLFVITGALCVSTGEGLWEGGAGEHLPLPSERHGVEALEDSAFLLSVALAAPTLPTPE